MFRKLCKRFGYLRYTRQLVYLDERLIKKRPSLGENLLSIEPKAFSRRPPIPEIKSV
jgi:hypothetical protein